MDDDLTDSKERLFEHGDAETWVEHVRRTYPEAWAEAGRRADRQAAFYRAHPRAFRLRRRLPRRWQRW